MNTGLLSMDEIESLLHHWEHTIDHGITWKEEDRDLTIEAITNSTLTLEEWKQALIKVPSEVGERYRKILHLLEAKHYITPEAKEYELKLMDEYSAAEMTRRGKFFSDFYRTMQHSFQVV